MEPTSQERTNFLQQQGRIEAKLDSTHEHIIRLDTRINGSFQLMSKHIEEGVEYRDRIIKLELNTKNLKEQISTIKQGYWKASIVAGIIGGLLGKITPEFFNAIIKIVGG